METPKFVHLHLHTDYSLLDGACDLEEVDDEAARRKMPAVAVTDPGNLIAGETQPRSDRVVRVFARRGYGKSCRRAAGSGARCRLSFAGHFRERKFLPG